MNLCISARISESWPRCRWVTITQDSTQSGWWSALWSATRSRGTLTSAYVFDATGTRYGVLLSVGLRSKMKQSRPAGFLVDGGWGRAWTTAAWRGSSWESWWRRPPRTMRECAGHPRCSSPRGWWGGLLPSPQTPNQVSSPKTVILNPNTFYSEVDLHPSRGERCPHF